MIPEIQSKENKRSVRCQIVFIKETLFLRNKTPKLKAYVNLKVINMF